MNFSVIGIFVLSLAIVSLCSATRKSSLPDGWVYTPIGPKPSDCVHTVPSGSIITDLPENEYILVNHPDGSSRNLTRCSSSKNILSHASGDPSPLVYDGWLAYTTYKSKDPQGFSSFLGYFSVPPDPQDDPSVLYLFTGLQNVDWIPIVDPEPPVFDIIQPVLQYPANTGNGWSVRSWYVTLDGGTINSEEILVSQGDNIFGNMTRTSNDQYYIGGTSSQTGRTSAITVNRQRLKTQPWAYNTLECYGCGYGGCDSEPTQPSKFTKLQLFDSSGKPETPTWVSHKSPNPICHEEAVVNSPSDVVIYFDHN